MPTHRSLDEQRVYELNLYYKDLKGLSNTLQIQGHFFDGFNNLTFVFPYLGVNVYPTNRRGKISYMRQLLVALDALWRHHIIHCNIKGGSKPNAIFDITGKLTLIDLESAIRRHELIDQEYTYSPGTEETHTMLRPRCCSHSADATSMVQPGLVDAETYLVPALFLRSSC